MSVPRGEINDLYIRMDPQLRPHFLPQVLNKRLHFPVEVRPIYFNSALCEQPVTSLTLLQQAAHWFIESGVANVGGRHFKMLPTYGRQRYGVKHMVQIPHLVWEIVFYELPKVQLPWPLATQLLEILSEIFVDFLADDVSFDGHDNGRPLFSD